MYRIVYRNIYIQSDGRKSWSPWFASKAVCRRAVERIKQYNGVDVQVEKIETRRLYTL